MVQSGAVEVDIRFSNDVSQISAVQPIAHLDHALKVQVAINHHAVRVNLENLQATDLVGEGDLNLSVQATGSEQRGVEGVGSVCSHDDLGLAQVVETVQLVEQLHQRSLDFSIRAGSLGESSSTDGVDFVHEDDAGLVLLGVSEHFADESC